MAAWDEWVAYRQEQKKPVSERSAKMSLKELEKMGVTRAIAAINHSIANGWQGIFEPKGNGAHPPSRNAGTYNARHVNDYTNAAE